MISILVMQLRIIKETKEGPILSGEGGPNLGEGEALTGPYRRLEGSRDASVMKFLMKVESFILR